MTVVCSTTPYSWWPGRGSAPSGPGARMGACAIGGGGGTARAAHAGGKEGVDRGLLDARPVKGPAWQEAVPAPCRGGGGSSTWPWEGDAKWQKAFHSLLQPSTGSHGAGRGGATAQMDS